MAIFYMKFSIVRANGGGAIAHSAYINATTMYSERLDKTYSYEKKQEVIHTELQVPAHCPDSLRTKETLWNSVEKGGGKNNSMNFGRYARQLVVATPLEWTNEETIERAREYIEEQFVSKGMCADWAFHAQPGNPHLHILLTVHPVDENGRWLSNERKVFVLDEKGERIPAINEATGEQKVRIHIKGGKEYSEKIWVRETVSLNDWNRRSFVTQVRKAWSEHCNKYLEQENHIDHRSYKERELDIIPQVHEGYAAHHIAKRCRVSSRIEENTERKELNSFFIWTSQFMEKAKNELISLKKKIKEVLGYDKGRSVIEERFDNGIIESNRRLSYDSTRADFGTGEGGTGEEKIGEAYRRLSEYRERLAVVTKRARETSCNDSQSENRKSELEGIVEMTHKKKI